MLWYKSKVGIGDTAGRRGQRVLALSQDKRIPKTGVGMILEQGR